MEDPNEEYCDAKEVAERMGCSTETVRRLIRQGRLVGRKVGPGRTSKWSVSVPSLVRFLVERGDLPRLVGSREDVMKDALQALVDIDVERVFDLLHREMRWALFWGDPSLPQVLIHHALERVEELIVAAQGEDGEALAAILEADLIAPAALAAGVWAGMTATWLVELARPHLKLVSPDEAEGDDRPVDVPDDDNMNGGTDDQPDDK